MGWLKVLEVGMAVLAVIALQTAVLNAARSKSQRAQKSKGADPPH
jgi:hypothetical protein